MPAAAGPARATTFVETVYDGSQCHPGSYLSADQTSAVLGYCSIPDEMECPIQRTQPTWQHLYVEAYFRDVVSSDGTNPGTVTCTLKTPNAQDSALATDTASLSGVMPGSSVFMSVVNTPVAGESLWNAMNAATPMWRKARLVCDQLPTNVRLLNYVVTEEP
ncbi:MAG TPA: hypothetical protein VH560_12810 [Polyangia bacterium]|nr:hypothetical protein [Polyangia bacterium]